MTASMRRAHWSMAPLMSSWQWRAEAVGCPGPTRFLDALENIFYSSRKISDDLFYQLSNFKTIRSLDAPSRRACFKKNSSLHIWPKMFRTTFLGILPPNLQFYPSKILMTFFSPPLFTISYPCAFDRLPRISCSLTPNFRHINLLTIVFLGFYLNYIFSLENSDDLFLVITIFTIYALPYFHVLQIMTPIPNFCTLYTPLYTHPHAVFTFLHLALCSRNS